MHKVRKKVAVTGVCGSKKVESEKTSIVVLALWDNYFEVYALMLAVCPCGVIFKYCLCCVVGIIIVLQWFIGLVGCEKVAPGSERGHFLRADGAPDVFAVRTLAWVTVFCGPPILSYFPIKLFFTPPACVLTCVWGSI